MQQHERDYFIYRICAGYLKYNDLKIVSPSSKTKYEAQELYNDIYEECLSRDIPTLYDILYDMVEADIWTPDMEKEYTDTIPDNLKKFKVELYQASFQSNKTRRIRTYLDATKTELERLHNIRHSWYHWTTEGIAGYIKLLHIIERSTIGYDPDKHNIFDIFAYYQRNQIEEEQMRELSRTSPWSQMWTAGKKSGQLFENDYLTDDQRRLVSWSSTYDNIHESMECPHSSIIEDDDMIDGWIIIQHQKREDEQIKKQGEAGYEQNERIKNANEIFITADTKDDAARIDRMNDLLGSRSKRQRLNKIQRQGKVQEFEFDDVQSGIRMTANKLEKDKIKGK